MRCTSVIGFGLVIGFFLWSCSDGNDPGSKESKRKDSTAHLTTTYKKPSSTHHDTLTISSGAAVFYSPDSMQWNKLKATVPKNTYETETHNCYYQMRNARMVIKKYYPGLRVIEASSARFLLFIKDDKSSIYIDLDTKGDMCGIFLFDRKKDPELIDMMNIDTALRFYFEK